MGKPQAVVNQVRAFTMPKWGIEMSEGTIGEWMIKEGASFSKGDILTLIETDKITNEVEAEFDGRLARILVGPGETVPVGALLGVLTSEQVDAAIVDKFISDFVPADTKMASAGAASSEPSSKSKPDKVAASGKTTIASTVLISPAARTFAEENGVGVDGIAGRGRSGRITLQDVLLVDKPLSFTPSSEAVSIEALGQVLEGVFASPLAKRIAVLNSIDLSTIKGTGPRGRISRADLTGKLEAKPLPSMSPDSNSRPRPISTGSGIDGPYEAQAMTSMRKAIARQLSYSKQTIPHFYLRFSVQLDAIGHLRQLAKQATGTAPSVNDYLVRAAALALAAHPDINIQLHGEEIRRFTHSNISVAVETPKGLVTPVVRQAEGKSVAQISSEIRQLADRARNGRMQADEMTGGSFSISNLGMFGVESFDAIINPPQGAILAVGAGIRKPVDSNYAVAFSTMASLSLSFDHRAIDGAAGARFGQTLKRLIEEPARLTA